MAEEEQQDVVYAGARDAVSAGNKAANRINELMKKVWDHEVTPEEAGQQVAKAATTISSALIAVANGPSLPAIRDGGPPENFPVPAGLIIPRERSVVYAWLRARWTPQPNVGISRPGYEGKWRCFIAWELTDGEERVALKRVLGEPERTRGELAKQMIRAVDGYKADWAADNRNPGGIDNWWTTVGPKCRAIIMGIYDRMHHMGAADQIDFFESCIEHAMGG